MSRFAHSIYSDDVRHEIGNKRSIIGIYTGKMFVTEFPVVLPRLCISTVVVTPINRPFKELRFRLLSDDEVVLDSPLDKSHFPSGEDEKSEGENAPRVIIANFEMQVSPFPVQKAITLRVRIITEEEELKGGALSIELAPKNPQ